MTERDAVITALRAIAPELKARSVREVWLFGSAARGELHAASDVDLLIDFEAPVTLFEFHDCADISSLCFSVRWTWSRATP